MGIPRLFRTADFQFSKLLSVHLVASLFALTATLSNQATAGVVVLHEFDGTNGSQPCFGMERIGDTLFGTTQFGGAGGDGTVFRIDTDGNGFQTLREFDSSDGARPLGVTLHGETLYGATFQGGSANWGTLYRVDEDGSDFESLHSFQGPEGAYPFGITIDGDTMYAVTSGHLAHNAGTLTKLDLNTSILDTLHTFNISDFTTGITPAAAIVRNGNTLYGQTSDGGSASAGTLYSINTDGTNYQRFHDFSASLDGSFTLELLLHEGVLYGTTSGFFSSTLFGSIFSINPDGSNFQVLHQFDGIDGRNPQANLTIIDDRLFGSAYGGGDTDDGTIFSVGLNGSDFRVHHEFDGTDGSGPASELVYHNGNLYGTTFSGGTFDDGVVFAIAVPEPSTMLLSGVAGSGVAIIGLLRSHRRAAKHRSSLS